MLPSASLAPPPSAPNPSSEFGPIPAAGVEGPITPMPGMPDPGAAQDAMNVADVNRALKSMADRHPNIVTEIQQMNDLLQQVQMKLISVQMPMQPAAPPV